MAGRKLTKAEQRAADERRASQNRAIATVAKVTIPAMVAVILAGYAGAADVVSNALQAWNPTMKPLEPVAWWQTLVNPGLIFGAAAFFVWQIRR